MTSASPVIPPSLPMLMLLAVGKDESATMTTLKRRLRRDVIERYHWTKFIADAALKQTHAHLQSAGDIKSDGLLLTSVGCERVLEFLKLRNWPREDAWTQLRNRDLVARALNVEPRSETERARLATATGLRAAVLARQFALPLDPLPSLKQVLQQIAWMQCESPLEALPPTTAPFNAENVIRVALLSGRSGPVAATLAADTFSLRDQSVAALRDALLHRFFDDYDNGHATSRVSPPSEALPARHSADSSTTAGNLSPLDFARRLHAIARTLPRYGESKVFLAEVRDAVLSQRPPLAQSADDFNRQLLAAQHAGAISLSRADFVAAMNQEIVRRSEVLSKYASFHFLRLPPETA